MDARLVNHIYIQVGSKQHAFQQGYRQLPESPLCRLRSTTADSVQRRYPAYQDIDIHLSIPRDRVNTGLPALHRDLLSLLCSPVSTSLLWRCTSSLLAHSSSSSHRRNESLLRTPCLCDRRPCSDPRPALVCAGVHQLARGLQYNGL